MQYIISFLEGIITFISPCLLPMLPIYVAYFAGGVQEGAAQPESPETSLAADKASAPPVSTPASDGVGGATDTGAKTAKKSRALVNAMGFALGFTLVFVALGAFAGTLGALLSERKTAVNLIGGAVVVLFGLNYLGVFNIGFLNATKRLGTNVKPLGFGSALVFGAVFAVGWTPCVGAFLGSALLLASQQGSTLKGMALLLVYSLGLGIPFVASAALIERLKGAFTFIKKNYKVINIVCGAMLVALGLLMMTGRLSSLLSALSFAA